MDPRPPYYNAPYYNYEYPFVPSKSYEFSHRLYSSDYYNRSAYPRSYDPYYPNANPYSNWDRSYYGNPLLSRSYEAFWNREPVRPYYPSYGRRSLLYETPTYERPLYDRPLYERPLYERPLYERPYERPLYERPLYERPEYDYDYRVPPPPVRPIYERPPVSRREPGFREDPRFTYSRVWENPMISERVGYEAGLSHSRYIGEDGRYYYDKEKKVRDDNYFEIHKKEENLKKKEVETPTHHQKTKKKI